MKKKLNKELINYPIIIILVTMSVLLFVSCGEEKTKLDLIVQLPAKIEAWALVGAPEQYDRQSIFDYIDGAGEVYLAYNFRDVKVYHYMASGKPEITVELYDMGSDKDAYGIFSYTRQNEQAGIGNGYDFMGSLLCFWQGKYFVNITTTEETEETKGAMLNLARAVSGKLPSGGERPRLLRALPPENLDLSGVLYFHAFSILNNEYYLSSGNILNLDSAAEAVLGTYRPDKAILLVVKYQSEEEAKEARDKFIERYAPNIDSSGDGTNEKGKNIKIFLDRDYLSIVLDASSKSEADAIIDKCREMISKLE